MTCALAACGADDGTMFPPTGDDAPDAEPPGPDAEGADADPNAPDAEPGPDAATDDMMGPLIVAMSPLPGSMVSGEITLLVQVTDDDGVDDVAATIGSTNTIDLDHVANSNNWIGTFDTTVLAGKVFVPIVVRATDIPGNMSTLGFEVVLDNLGPIASLDPPRVREAEATDTGIACSVSFDPLGSDAPNDGQRVLQLSELRARVFDVGNTGTSLSEVFIPSAGVASVEIYVLDDTTKPLVVSNDGDAACEDINPQIVPTLVPSAANEAAVVDLTAVPATGESYFPDDMGGDPFAGTNVGCEVGADAEAPPDLCFFADATRVIQTPALATPEIYVIPLVSELACMGSAFDAAAANIADGWACVAVRAVDALGNVRVSAPLRICIDSNADSAAPCDSAMPAGAPDCLGTYVPATGAVNQTDCTPDVIAPLPSGAHELIRRDF